ncbi:MAG TPA: hypothetical protein VLW44_07690 [Streptosporangiaceae bacterium]|nr:hypothetical protein [Streptosporangiaceae bacterium]
MQVLRCRAGRGCLGSMLLSLTQLGDGGGERSEVRHQRRGEQAGVVGDATGHGQQPRGRAQAVPISAAARDPAVTGAGGAVVGVGCAAQDRAAQRPRRDM